MFLCFDSNCSHPAPWPNSFPLSNQETLKTLRFWSASSSLRNKVLGLLTTVTEFSIKLKITFWPQFLTPDPGKQNEPGEEMPRLTSGPDVMIITLYPSTNQSGENMNLTPLVSMINDFFSLSSPPSGSHGEPGLWSSLSVTPDETPFSQLRSSYFLGYELLFMSYWALNHAASVSLQSGNIKLVKVIDIQAQEVHRVPNKMNPKRLAQ